MIALTFSANREHGTVDLNKLGVAGARSSPAGTETNDSPPHKRKSEREERAQVHTLQTLWKSACLGRVISGKGRAGALEDQTANVNPVLI